MRPGTTDVYVIFAAQNNPPPPRGQFYLGIYRSDNTIFNLGEVSNGVTFSGSWRGLTFDCSGQLYAVDTLTGDIYTIDGYNETLLTNITFTLRADSVQDEVCGGFNPSGPQCTEVIGYNWDNGLIYRISDSGRDSTGVRPNGGNLTLFTYAPPYTTEVEVALTPSATNPNVCPDEAGIESMEYIGNYLFFLGVKRTLVVVLLILILWH